MGHIPRKYIPKTLSKRDYKKQQTNINHTRKLYKKRIYMDRPKVKSFKSKPSPHVKTAKKLYGIENIVPS